MEVEFLRASPDGDIASTNARFVSPSSVMLRVDELDEQLETVINRILDLIENFISNGSGWTIERIKSSTIHCAAYYQIGGGSYLPLPKWLVVKRALLNIENVDDMCFAYSVLAHIHPKRSNPSRVRPYQRHLHELNLAGLTWPMAIKKIPLFEKNNADIAINVCYCDRDCDKQT